MTVVGRRTDYGKRAAFAFADGAEGIQIFFQNRQHITLLRFVTPNLQWVEAVFFQRYFAQLEYRAAAGIVDEFGEGVGQAACADVVDGDNRVFVAELPAAVDDFLRAAFNFGVAALYGVEVQRGIIRACIHGRSRAAAQADKHTRTTQLDQQCAFGDFVFVCLLCLNAAQTAGNHNWFVIAANLTVEFFFKSTEVAQEVWTAEFVVERCATNRAFNHNV